MCTLLRIALVALLVVPLADARPRPSNGRGGRPGLHQDLTLTVAGATRHYRLYVPKRISARRPLPLVYAFHGRGGSKDRMPLYCGLDRLAAKQSFVLVYPSAIGGNWTLNPGRGNADLAFFDAIHAQLIKAYNIDLDRVYLTGMSMGGYFCNVLASQRPDVVAAIAPHSGGLGWLRMGVRVKRKYAVLVIHGDKDAIVPVREGRQSRDVYTRAGHPTEYVELAGLGHRWATAHKINDRIWAFFAKHPRRP